jgi:trk system potassium uptake protein TrkA
MYVVIAGINTLSRRMVKRLEGSHDVVVIDEDQDKCERLYSSSGATVINKAPTTISALEDAGITQADALITTMKDDNQNMVVCSLGKKFGVPKVVSRLDDDEYFEAFEIIGADTIGHNDILLSEFLSAIEHPYLVKLANLSGERELLKASVETESDLRGDTIDEVRDRSGFPDSFKIISVLTDGNHYNNDFTVELEKGSELILIGPEKDKESLDEFFQRH